MHIKRVRYKQVCTKVYSEGQKNSFSQCCTRLSNSGSSNLNSDALTTDLRPQSLTIQKLHCGLLNRIQVYIQKHTIGRNLFSTQDLGVSSHPKCWTLIPLRLRRRESCLLSETEFEPTRPLDPESIWSLVAVLCILIIVRECSQGFLQVGVRRRYITVH